MSLVCADTRGIPLLFSPQDGNASDGKPTVKPTLRWVFQLFLWVRLVSLEGQVAVLDLKPHHERVARLLGVGRYYLLD
jgi:hypothetical protein